MEMFYNECGEYPDVPGDGNIDAAVTNSSCSSVTLGDFMSQVPTDPSQGSYQMATTSASNSYCIGTDMEGDSAPANDANCGPEGGTNGNDQFGGSVGGSGVTYTIQP